MKNAVILATLSLLITGCNDTNLFGRSAKITRVSQIVENVEEVRGGQSDAPAEDYDQLHLPPAEQITSQNKQDQGLLSVESDPPTVIIIDDKSKAKPAPVTAAPVKPLPAVSTPPVKNPPVVITAQTPAKAQPANPATTPAKPSPPVTPAPTPVKAAESLLTRASTFVKNAIWVMVNEGKKIGTPCNFFLRRVLEVSGFAKAGFIANDFDEYADRYFASSKHETFKYKVDEKERLRQYLWSFPSGTPFIMNWHKDGVRYGHVAIVERYDDQLRIYQASIHSYTARQEITTVKSLLDDSLHRDLTVYSNFTRK